MNEHPTLDELVAYPLGKLSVERSRQVWQHCSGCHACGNELSAIILVRSNAITDDPVEREGWDWKYLAVAAAVVLAAGIVWVSWGLLPNLSGEPRSTPEPPATTTTPDYTELATSETLPQSHVDFWFGVAEPAAEDGVRVRDGVQAIVDGRYEDAERTLRALMLSNPSEQIAVHLGIALYLQGELSDEAANLLQAAASASGSLGHAAQWYLGNLLLARGEIDAARSVLEGLGPRTSDRWQRRARELLDKLPRP